MIFDIYDSTARYEGEPEPLLRQALALAESHPPTPEFLRAIFAACHDCEPLDIIITPGKQP